MSTTDEAVERVYRDFWADIVAPNGDIDLELVKRELHDYYLVMKEVSRVYAHISNGRISKPNTRADVLIAMVDDLVNNEPEGEQDNQFLKELQNLINRYNKENDSDTPDFILAQYLNNCLESFDIALRQRSDWGKVSNETD